MALQKKKLSEIPSDAVILTEEEAWEYHLNLIKNWEPASDTRGFRWGPYILAGATFYSSLYINTFFRRKLKLLHYGRLSTYLPVVVIPTTFTTVFHVMFVQSELLLQKQGSCPLCLEMRASAAQAFISTAFPLVLASVSNLSMAHKFATYTVPDVTHEPKKVLSLLRGKIAPAANVFFAMFVGQALLASAVTYFEAKSIAKVHDKLSLLE